MSEEIKIPHGFKQILGPTQKGDGVWNGTRFEKVKKGYPVAGGVEERVFIRKCEVEQPALPGADVTPSMEID